MIEITFTLSEKDILKIVKNKQLMPLRIVYGIFILLFVFTFLPGLLFEGQPLTNTMLQFILVIILLVAVVEWWWPWFFKRTLSRSPSLGQPMSYRFTTDHIEQKSARAQTQMQWSSITKAKVKNDHLLLYLGSKHTYLQIPNDAIDHMVDREELFDLIRSKGLLA